MKGAIVYFLCLLYLLASHSLSRSLRAYNCYPCVRRLMQSSITTELRALLVWWEKTLVPENHAIASFCSKLQGAINTAGTRLTLVSNT